MDLTVLLLVIFVTYGQTMDDDDKFERLENIVRNIQIDINECQDRSSDIQQFTMQSLELMKSMIRPRYIPNRSGIL